MLARTTASGTLYPLYDGSGNILAWTDQTGAVVSSTVYSAFGEVLSQTGPVQPFGFSTKPYSAATGLSYFGARSYRPDLARWLTTDPLGLVDGPNVYGFVGNNPVNVFDPFGLKKRGWWDEWLWESVVPGPYGQPISEWGLSGPTDWGDPLKYTEAAGGGWQATERIAVGTAAAATAVAAGAILAGADPWVGSIGIHPPHHGLGRHFELIWRLARGKNFKLIIPGKDRWIWWGVH